MKKDKVVADEKEKLWLLINSKPHKTYSLKGTYDYASAVSLNNLYIAVQIQNEDEERVLLIYNTILKRSIKLKKSDYRQLIFSLDSNILVGLQNKLIQLLRLKSTAKKFKVDKQSQLDIPKHFASQLKMEFKTDKNQLFVYSIEFGQFAIWNLVKDELIVIVNYYLKNPEMKMRNQQEDSNLLGIIKKMKVQYQVTMKDYQKQIFKYPELISVEYSQNEGGMMIKCRNKILRKHYDNQFEDESKSLQISSGGTRILYVTEMLMYLYSVQTGNILLKKKIYNVEQLILSDNSLIVIEGDIIKFWDITQI
ncbi:unnamed protein product [Paramecium sonneborni]|uniref:Uncharacterized protein n=1 Tax=Paramecium sonneborni TaxID=65129 RepID=A0A8S1R3V5_9CILI|nr:unnamed protein product [Paramecium sonneborni]